MLLQYKMSLTQSLNSQEALAMAAAAEAAAVDVAAAAEAEEGKFDYEDGKNNINSYRNALCKLLNPDKQGIR